MSRKSAPNPRGSTGLDADLEPLYLDLLHRFYEEDGREGALAVAGRLEKALADRPDFANSIRGEEVRSLLAELHGDLAGAIQSRQSEIRKIRELHSLAQGTPGWDYVFRQYDYRDVSDRLDLLAILYAEAGNDRGALKILQESKDFCASHRIPFDGENLLEEFSQASPATGHEPEGFSSRPAGLDRLD